MPIPVLQTEEIRDERPAGLHVVGAHVAPVSSKTVVYSRALAHLVDLCVVQGFSLYVSKFFSVIFLAIHSREVGGATGKVTGPLFRQAYDYSSAQLLAASFAALSIVYFVVLPLTAGRTLGLGLFGLRITGESGERPTVRQLTVRLLGGAITYATFGLLCVVGLRQREGRFWHDQISETQITKD